MGDGWFLVFFVAFFSLPFASIAGAVFGALQCILIFFTKRQSIPLLINGVLGCLACLAGVEIIGLLFSKQLFSSSKTMEWLRVSHALGGFVCGCVYTARMPKPDDEHA